MRGALRVKRGQRGWFAAGVGMERALGELSDAAFKVFVHVCLRAERASGCLEFRRRELARAVGKSRSALGSVRKSMSMLDRPGGEPVPSPRNFAGLLEEVRTESFPPSYWRHVGFSLRRCERLWRNRPVEGTGSARPDLAQADSSGGTRKPSSAAQVGDKKETG